MQAGLGDTLNSADGRQLEGPEHGWMPRSSHREARDPGSGLGEVSEGIGKNHDGQRAFFLVKRKRLVHGIMLK